ncbi:MAG TPA: hypothetical protein VN461_02935 [Vicinamibacteria bacterium]|nr:hypothetical protein [Vicinamibacteria bacterium]
MSSFGCGSANRIFEVGLAEQQRAAKDCPIDSGDGREGEQIAHDAACKRGAPLAGGQVEDGRDPVGGD